MKISDWPEDERPREKLLARGVSALSNAELLALFLRTGVRGTSAVELARELLSALGGLSGLLQSTQAQFCSCRGLGLAKYAQLQAVLEIKQRALGEAVYRGDVISNPAITREYLNSQLRGFTSEVFSCLFLDTRHRVIHFEHLFYGTIDGASVYPREVVKKALKHNAAALIFAHNHPSGVAEPSSADESITRRLKYALALVDIRVLDHFIIGDEVVSMAERGLL